MRDFFKYVLATCVALLLFAGTSIGLLVAIVTALTFSEVESESDVEAASILTLDLSVPIPDTPPSSTAGQVLGDVLSGQVDEPVVPLRQVINAIEAAAEDERIVGLYIEGQTAASGFATLREVREAVETFQASGKPVMAYDMGWNERSYYLVSIVDQLLLNPSGLMELNGFSAESLFFAGALEKYGIGVSAIRAGQYKSAVEPFTRSDRSPEEKAQTEALLAALWDEFLESTSVERDASPSAFQAIADRQGLLLPEAAVEAGLVDELAYADEVLAKLHELTGEDPDESSFRQVSVSAYASELEPMGDGDGFLGSDQTIAVVYAEGGIVNGEGIEGQVGGDRFSRILREIRLDDDIKAVVLRVNSPGGSAAAAEQMAREIQLMQEVKPVIVSMGNVAASGGYLIATHAQEILASPNTITGSIGVFGLFPNFQDIANRNGITWDVVKTGQFADIGTVSRPPTEAELAIAQRFVDQVYDTFLGTVATSRPLTRSQLEPIAQGRVWAGSSANSLGLVDGMGGLNAAIAQAAEAAELGENWVIEDYPKARRFEAEVVRQLFGTRLRPQRQEDWVTHGLERVGIELEMLRSLNDPHNTYMRLPINYWID